MGLCGWSQLVPIPGYSSLKLYPTRCLSDPRGRQGFLASDQEEKPFPAWISEYEVFKAPRVFIHLHALTALGGTVLRAGTQAWLGVSKDQEDETGPSEEVMLGHGRGSRSHSGKHMLLRV